MSRAKSARFSVRLGVMPGDVEAAQALRYRAFAPSVFVAQSGAARDADDFDAACRHFLIEDTVAGTLVATFRALVLKSGADVDKSYSAQFYSLDSLKTVKAPVIELGRFCVAPGLSDPEVLRVAWGAITALVDLEGAELIFGCSSFKGTDQTAYDDAFAMLSRRHLAPARYCPGVKAPDVYRYTSRATAPLDRARALKTMPPLLRSYLTMGGWVSDHAVIDRVMNTLHVFTGLEVGRIPPKRAKVLRAVAG